MKIKYLLTFIFIYSFSLFAFSDIDIKSQMTPEDREKSGLNKLSSEELSYLNKWLNEKKANTNPRLTQAIPENTTPAKITRKEAEEILNAPIKTSVKGEFIGWTGKTVFYLSNGEVWKQRRSGFYRKKLDSPEVIIMRNFLGFYDMHIVATGRKVGVTRVK
jgi:hypothetical protein